MKTDEKRDDHSVKVTQCKRNPCRSISKPPGEAEELLSAGRVHARERPKQPPPTTRDPGCSRHRAPPELADLLTHGDG
jgi:hypothetical protein